MSEPTWKSLLHPVEDLMAETLSRLLSPHKDPRLDEKLEEAFAALEREVCRAFAKSNRGGQQSVAHSWQAYGIAYGEEIG
jgi:hypothetical protein